MTLHWTDKIASTFSVRTWYRAVFLLRRTVMIGLVTFVGPSVNDYKRSAAVFLLVCVYLVFHILIPPFVYAQDNNLQTFSLTCLIALAGTSIGELELFRSTQHAILIVAMIVLFPFAVLHIRREIEQHRKWYDTAMAHSVNAIKTGVHVSTGATSLTVGAIAKMGSSVRRGVSSLSPKMGHKMPSLNPLSPFSSPTAASSKKAAARNSGTNVIRSRKGSRRSIDGTDDQPDAPQEF